MGLVSLELNDIGAVLILILELDNRCRTVKVTLDVLGNFLLVKVVIEAFDGRDGLLAERLDTDVYLGFLE